jgi:two-component system nitrogen regulation response regulator GlnG
MPKLLIIDDEPAVRFSFEQVYADDSIEVVSAATAGEGLELARVENPDVIVLDLQLPDRSGLDILPFLQEMDPARPVVFITAHGTADTAIEAMKQGAFEYLVKPVQLDQLTAVLDRAFTTAQMVRTPTQLSDDAQVDRIVGSSRVMQEVCKRLGRIAPQDVTVLITGESGTGKELIARALYQHSKRARKPFLAINCAAIPEQLLESELFGHEKGAFTGADRRRIGKFEQCDGGTLLLDEIGDMPVSLQAKMLRLLQDQQFERLGGSETLQTNVRLIAATNQDLARLVAEGRFRADLFYRLQVVTIAVPPLRERPSDIIELSHYLLFRYNQQLGLDLRGFATETLAYLQAYSWPGNVRELQGVLQHAMLNASGPMILPEFLPPHLLSSEPLIPTKSPVAVAVESGSSTAEGTSLGEIEALAERLLHSHPGQVHEAFVAETERVLLARVVQFTRGHQGKAAELLGISRVTLRHKLRALGLAQEKGTSDADASDGLAEGES